MDEPDLATETAQANGRPQHLNEGEANGILPGVTFPSKSEPNSSRPADLLPPSTFDGPEVNGLATTVTLCSPSQLRISPLYSPLCDLIIESFGTAQINQGTIYVPEPRLLYNDQLLDELGNTPGTFTFIVHYVGTNAVIATASAKRYIGEMTIVELETARKPKQGNSRNTFKRFSVVPEGTEAWELSIMAVDPKLQRQGLAGYLMRITEDETRRRFKGARGRASDEKLLQMITTIKDMNESFYARRGFTKDYETWYEQDHLGGDAGFSVINMSREVSLEEVQT